MTEIINHLVEIERHEDSHPANLQSVPLKPILTATLERNKPLAAQKQATLSLNYEKLQAFQVHANPKVLAQAFDNIVANGVKYSTIRI